MMKASARHENQATLINTKIVVLAGEEAGISTTTSIPSTFLVDTLIR